MLDLDSHLGCTSPPLPPVHGKESTHGFANVLQTPASWKRQYFPKMVIHPEVAIFRCHPGPGPEDLETQLCPFLLPQSLGVCWAGSLSPRTGVRLQIPEKLASVVPETHSRRPLAALQASPAGCDPAGGAPLGASPGVKAVISLLLHF